MKNEVGVIKSLWYWQGDRQNNQQKQIENLEIDPQKYVKMVFEEGAKTVVLDPNQEFGIYEAKSKTWYQKHDP